MGLKQERCANWQPVKEGMIAEFRPRRISAIYSSLSKLGYDFLYVCTQQDLANKIDQYHPKIVILANSAFSKSNEDFQTDLEASKFLHENLPECHLVFIINNKISVEACSQAINSGACGFVNSDDPAFLELLIDQIQQARKKISQNDNKTHDYLDQSVILDETGIATHSANMLKLLSQARKAANVSDAPIIIEGESGTGKQLLSQAIHKMDAKRSNRSFLSVNCASITGTLAESELFGHKKGAFTGASEDRMGYFRSANGGTLLLDEISELEPHLQPKMLRILQEGKVLPVGDDKEYKVDVRVIASSNKPLAQQVAQDKFRLDLYQRLNVIKLHIPPLRERLEDIPLLVQYFLKKYKHYYHREIKSVDPVIYAILKHAIGKGNVRELENIIRQTLAFKSHGTTLVASDLPEQVQLAVKTCEKTDQIPADLSKHIVHQLTRGNIKLDRLLQQFEYQLLHTAMTDFGLKGTQLAQRLGVNRRTLYNKLKKHNLVGSD